MPIVSSPRQIHIDLDPDLGFPVRVCVEFTRYMDEDGVNIADLPPHIETYPPDGKELKKIMNAAGTAAVSALIPYQQDLQRVAIERDDLKADRDQIKADRDQLKIDRDQLRAERDALKAERDALKAAKEAAKESKLAVAPEDGTALT